MFLRLAQLVCEMSGVRSLLALVLPPLLVSTTAEPHSVCERAGCRKLLEDIGLAGNQAEPETGKPFTGFFSPQGSTRFDKSNIM